MTVTVGKRPVGHRERRERQFEEARSRHANRPHDLVANRQNLLPLARRLGCQLLRLGGRSLAFRENAIKRLRHFTRVGFPVAEC